MAFGLVKRRVPWTRQPPHRIEQFDQSNFFGKRCVWAMVPGWHYVGGDGGPVYGTLVSVGQRQEFPAESINAVNSQLIERVPRSYGGGVGEMLAVHHVGSSRANGIRFRRDVADDGIIFPNSRALTLVALVKPDGDGRASTSSTDPRIYSQDDGTSTGDHDLMIGIASNGNAARTRLRINNSTQTVIIGGAIEDDALNMIAGIVTPVGATNAQVVCRHMSESNAPSRNTGSSQGGGYTPRTNTTAAIFANAGVGGGSTANPFNGDIICIYAFDGALDSDEIYQNLFHNPWQLFEPLVQYLPIGTGGTAVTLTPVDTSQAQSSDTAGVTEHNVVAESDTAQAQASDTSALTEHNVLAADETSQAQASDTVSVSSATAITALDTAQAQASDSVAIDENAVVAAVETAQAQASDTASLDENASLAATETSQAQASDQATITEAAVVSASDTAQAQASDQVTVTPSGTAQGVDTAQAQASDTAALTEHAVVAATDTSQAQTSDTVAVSTATALAANDTAQAQSSDTASLAEHNIAAAVETAQSQASDTVAVTQVGVAQGADTQQGQASDLVALVQHHILTPSETIQQQSSHVVVPAAPVFTAPQSTRKGIPIPSHAFTLDGQTLEPVWYDFFAGLARDVNSNDLALAYANVGAQSFTVTYDTAGRIETVVLPGETLTYTYNSFGAISTIANGIVTRTFSYNSFGVFTGVVVA